MARKRAPEHDYVCTRCGCPCGPYGGKHLGGGTKGMRACDQAAPRLRSEWEAELAADAKAAAEAIREWRARPAWRG